MNPLYRLLDEISLLRKRGAPRACDLKAICFIVPVAYERVL